MDVARPDGSRKKRCRGSKNGDSVMDLVGELHRDGATIWRVTAGPRFARHADHQVYLFDERVVEESTEATAQ